MRSFSFSNRELFDIFKAYVAITLAFGILLLKSGQIWYQALFVAAITVGAGFIVHELAHKFVAQHYRCRAEFRSSDIMLLLAIVFALFTSFIFAAPGAVMISNVKSKKEFGHIAAAGPASNIVLALAFLLVPIASIAWYGFFINAPLAAFNMLPFGSFDGKKILSWNRTVFTIMFVVSVGLFVWAFI
jgi:Zn-dependent protease